MKTFTAIALFALALPALPGCGGAPTDTVASSGTTRANTTTNGADCPDPLAQGGEPTREEMHEFGDCIHEQVQSGDVETHRMREAGTVALADGSSIGEVPTFSGQYGQEVYLTLTTDVATRIEVPGDRPLRTETRSKPVNYYFSLCQREDFDLTTEATGKPVLHVKIEPGDWAGGTEECKS